MKRKIQAGAALLAVMFAATARSDVTLPKVFSDHMVLQRSANTPIWGSAQPGEKVRVRCGDASAETETQANGSWHTKLDLSKAGSEPLAMTVEGANTIRIEDVLIGEVWLCSGQSNMEFTLNRAIGFETVMAKPSNPKLRQFIVNQNASLQPLDKLNGKWETLDLTSAKHFSAVGYFFGIKLQETLQVPVGLINASVGATPVEAWTSQEGLNRDADLKASAEKILQTANHLPELKKNYEEAYQTWEKSSGRIDNPTTNVAAFAQPAPDADWKKITLPGAFSSGGLPDAGAVWITKKIDVPPAKSGQPYVAAIGMPAGWETVYWNGAEIGRRTLREYRGEGENRTYTVPAVQVKAGPNVLAVRLFNATGGMGLFGKSPLSGEWLAKAESVLPPLNPDERGKCPTTFHALPEQKKVATVLFNGMIHPLIPYAMKGVIWYQGEHNTERAYQYRKAFPLLIQDWRAHWGEGEFPFYFCQLANHRAKDAAPEESEWAELREAQTMTLAVPNTGEAILIDTGEAADIHPRDKKDAGDRLAAIALAQSYRQNIPFSGPVYQSMSVEGNKIRVHFRRAENGLVARPLPPTFVFRSELNVNQPLTRNSPASELEGFSVCDVSHHWVWANARIDGETVVVESPQISTPVAVRYAWADNPTCNLYDKAGFPAGPFRSDHLPGLTADTKY